MTDDGYPTEEQLDTITLWNFTDFHGLMEYVHAIWWMPDWGWKQTGDEYHISTGGWSGNEEIIAAMQNNLVWWATFWQSAHRGGHYVFRQMEE